ncbi:MAG: molybdopterin synthase catalytic subunit [Parasphingorhabdus sp.]|jgi:molybdopterin synthase catalytic subunit
MIISIRSESFNPWDELAEISRSRLDLKGRFGACATFVGTMRDFNEGDDVVGMELEYYPSMTESQLEQIMGECCVDHEVLECMVIHRVGKLLPGDDIVLVGVWTPHRKSAFIVCREIMEALKSRAPFWKKETLRDGQRWVSKNTAG